jgi:tetratricopeptide (TPR) repeat protein
MHVPRPPIPPDQQKWIEDHLTKAVAILDRLVSQHPNIPEYRVSQANISHKLGTFLRQANRFSESEQGLRKAVAIQTSLVQEFPDAPYYRVWLGTFQIALADVLIRSNQVQEARPVLKDAIGLLRRLLDEQPSMGFLHGQISRAYSNLALLERQSGNRDAAEDAARQARQQQGLLAPASQ